LGLFYRLGPSPQRIDWCLVDAAFKRLLFIDHPFLDVAPAALTLKK
jgi:hypothetical protein